jgi:hypothetical protein
MTGSHFSFNSLFIKGFNLTDLSAGRGTYYTIDIIVIVSET